MKTHTKMMVWVGVFAAGYAAVAIAAWRIMPGKIAEAEQKRVGMTMAKCRDRLGIPGALERMWK